MSATAFYVAGAAANVYAAGRRSRAVRRAASRRAWQARVAAGNAKASAQRLAMEQERQAELLASRALAVASAGGSGADDPTVSRIISDIEGEGAYRAAVAMYEGETQARKYIEEGRLAIEEGDAAADSARLSSIGSVLEAGAHIYG